MDFERLERAWRGAANTPSAAASAYVTEEMMETLRRRRRSTMSFTGFIGLLLVLWTARIGWEIATDPFPFDPGREWGVLLLFALPWVGLFLINRLQRRHSLAHPDPYASVAATLRALLDENRTARRRLIITSILMLSGLASLVLALDQLVEVDKMTPTNVKQALIAFGGLMAAIGAYKAWHYVRVLKPEGERLRRLLADYSA